VAHHRTLRTRGAEARGRCSTAGLALLVVSAAALLALAGCGSESDDDETSDPSTPAGAEAEAQAEAPFEVEQITETYVDGTRPTDAGSETPAQPDRTVEATIVHPTSGGPYPLLVLSHGLTGHPEEYEQSVPVWAADGFVVVRPAFPLTNADVPGAGQNVSDVVNQPGDVSFVIDEVLADAEDPEHPLHGLVDPEAIGVVGHSLGGATTWAVSFDSATRDDRIDSTVVFAGLTLPMPGGGLEPDSDHPLLVFHGDADDVPLDGDLAAYELAAPPKWFVTLHGAEHRIAFTDEPSPYDELVTTTLLDFWHGTLDGDAEALERVTADATDPELSTVQHE
jgi:dienelactone hydrolase